MNRTNTLISNMIVIKLKNNLIKYTLVIDVSFDSTVSLMFLSCSEENTGVKRTIPIRLTPLSRTNVEVIESKFFTPKTTGNINNIPIARTKLFLVDSFS